jgi:hypothetical protein
MTMSGSSKLLLKIFGRNPVLRTAYLWSSSFVSKVDNLPAGRQGWDEAQTILDTPKMPELV